MLQFTYCLLFPSASFYSIYLLLVFRWDSWVNENETKRSSTRRWKFTDCPVPSQPHTDLSLSSSVSQMPSLLSNPDSGLLALLAVVWDLGKLLLCFPAILRLLKLYLSFFVVFKNKKFSHRNNLSSIFLCFMNVNLDWLFADTNHPHGCKWEQNMVLLVYRKKENPHHLDFQWYCLLVADLSNGFQIMISKKLLIRHLLKDFWLKQFGKVLVLWDLYQGSWLLVLLLTYRFYADLQLWVVVTCSNNFGPFHWTNGPDSALELQRGCKSGPHV